MNRLDKPKANPCGRGYHYIYGPWGWLRNYEKISRLEHRIECLEYQLAEAKRR